MTLYELTNDYLMLLEMAEDPETDPEILKDTFEGIEGALEDKADAYAVIMTTLKSNEEMIDAEIKRLSDKKNAMKNHAEKMKETLKAVMEVTGKTKFKTDKFSFNIQKNPPRIVYDKDELPLEYLIPVEPKKDTERIKNELKEGKELPFAHFEWGTSLRFR